MEQNVPSWRESAPLAIPFVGATLARRSNDGLVAIRGIFLGFCSALILVALAVALLAGYADLSGGRASDTVVIAVASILEVAAVTASEVCARPLQCADEAAVAVAYRNRFFLQIALSQAASLIGFAAFILTNNPVIFVGGALLSTFGYARAAPTAANLARDTERLRVGGCDINVADALREHPRSQAGGNERRR